MDIYRRAALDKLSSPDRLDTMLYVVSSRLWLALLVIGVFIVSGVLWSIFGTLPITVTGFGVLSRAGEKIPITISEKSAVQSVLVDVGNEVVKDQPLLVLQNGTKITAPLAGRILSITVKPGDNINVNATAATLESTDNVANPLQVILFMNAIDGQTIEPGMPVQLTPSTVRSSETGFLRGVVKTVEKSPVSPERVSRVIGSSQVVETQTSGESLLEVQVELVEDATTPSGYAWSSVKGAPFKLYSGTVTTGTVIVGQQHPINLVFGN